MASGFSFETTWGANLQEGGQARFRLWAPKASKVDLVHQGVSRRDRLAMAQGPDGFWEIVTAEVPVGGGYGFCVDGGDIVADPAARAQLDDVHGLSKLVDPRAYEWKTGDWKGRPWHETVFYELHTGTFTAEGTFEAVIGKLDHIKAAGLTAIELLPVAQFGGERGWGYDGVLLYCPHKAYGGQIGLKRLVDAAHERGLMVFLDVVYNHFGPDGNYIPSYLPDFFHADINTAWGAAIAYDETAVREFMIENALYWLEEYRIDGLRLDAIDSIKDTTDTPLVEELSARVRERFSDRHVHITTEDERNITRFIERNEDETPKFVSGEWNDDFHHTAHAFATAEQEGYYADYAADSVEQMAKALATGFVYQGEHSEHRGKAVGEDSAHLPPTAFVNFIQNHDQIGNRAFGERLRSLASARAHDCLHAILLLSPQIPLIFQGDEFGDCNSFCFFTDFDGELGAAVSKGRKEEFAKFAAFEDPKAQEVFPDPNDPLTFQTSKIDWDLLPRPVNRRRLQVTQELLTARRESLMPLLANAPGNCGSALVDDRAFAVSWELAEGRVYSLFANLSDKPWEIEDGLLGEDLDTAELVYASHRNTHEELNKGVLPAWTVAFFLSDEHLVDVFLDEVSEGEFEDA